MGNLAQITKQMYAAFGQRKPMGSSTEPSLVEPYYFLLRPFLDKNDLLVILYTKRCVYHCAFCQLPSNKSKSLVSAENIEKQFEFVINEVKHSLSIIDRITLSNDGSILDSSTLPTSALYSIIASIKELKRVKTLVLETRLEFIDKEVIRKIQSYSSQNLVIDILTGFETHDDEIRKIILSKGETVEKFLSRLNNVSELGLNLTCYVLYKPSPKMNDDDAYKEASRTIDFLIQECYSRNIQLTLRLNPMYIAKGSKLADSLDLLTYKPPKLTDIMRLAEEKKKTCERIYIGLSTEGLDVSGKNYTSREDYSDSLIRPILLFNSQKISRFAWEEILPK
jgi:radical SAM enzyme (TIGR01210 family)